MVYLFTPFKFEALFHAMIMAKHNLLGNILRDHVSVTENWIVLITCVN